MTELETLCLKHGITLRQFKVKHHPTPRVREAKKLIINTLLSKYTTYKIAKLTGQSRQSIDWYKNKLK
jgi:hypothetical protein